MQIRTIKAHAKINLMLHVTGKLPDGYHALQSVFAFTDLADELTLQPSELTHVQFSGQFSNAVPQAQDSISRAIEWYFDYTKVPRRHYDIHCVKNIPIAAGLGGGTSDAASILAFLYQEDFTLIDQSRAWDLIKSSGYLGADVPVSLAFHLGQGKCFWVEGSGREGNIVPLKTRNLSRQLVFVNPGQMMSTADVFTGLGDRFDDSLLLPEVLTDDFMQNTRNILQAPAIQLSPEIPKIFMMFMLSKSYKYFRLSGSGATCFAVFRNKNMAQALADKVSANNRGWWVRKAQIIL